MKFETLWCGIPEKSKFLIFHICQVQGAVNPSNALKNVGNQNYILRRWSKTQNGCQHRIYPSPSLQYFFLLWRFKKQGIFSVDLPLTEFMELSSLGDQMHIPRTLGITTTRAPELLLLAGRPTCKVQRMCHGCEMPIQITSTDSLDWWLSIAGS